MGVTATAKLQQVCQYLMVAMMLTMFFSIALAGKSFAFKPAHVGAMIGNYSCGTPPVREGKGAAGSGITLWANGKVPYEIQSSFTQVDKDVFEASKKLIEEKTCIRYVPKTGSGPYLRLRRECACGQQGGDCFPGGYTDGLGANTPRELVMSAACMDGGSGDLTFFTHEMMHALGVIHTQNRPDRDNFVSILEDNIQPDALSQYELCSSCITHGTPYNCLSTMHYRDTFFNVDGKKTMLAKDSSQCDLQTSTTMVDSDWVLLNKMYNCQTDDDDDDEVEDSCDGGEDDWSCCTPSKPCGNGGGDCDTNSDCKQGHECGEDNCQTFHPSANKWADCCVEKKCGGGGDDWNCCTKNNPCPIGQGDCDNNSDCAEGLVCGTDNCRDTNPDALQAADCCMEVKCQGDSTNWNCCNGSNRCSEGGGDCDEDADCQDGLKCGENNCGDFHSDALPAADCCYAP